MDNLVKLNLLNKLFFSFKFKNNESYDEYLDLVTSPLYVSLFEEIRREILEYDPNLAIEKEQRLLNKFPQHLNRVKEILVSLKTNREIKKSLQRKVIEIVSFPYLLNEQTFDELESLLEVND